MIEDLEGETVLDDTGRAEVRGSHLAVGLSHITHRSGSQLTCTRRFRPARLSTDPLSPRHRLVRGKR